MGQKFRQNRSTSLRFQDKQVFAFNAEIQDGRQKSDTLWVKNFVEIALSCSISEINTFLCLTQKFKKPKVTGKWILWNVANRLCRYHTCQKFRWNRSNPLCFRHKQVFVFNAEIQDGYQKWQENYFWEKSAVDSAATLRVKNFVEIALSCSISEISGFLRLMQKFKMAAKSGGKMIFVKSCQ